jgi:hypothetical protein
MHPQSLVVAMIVLACVAYASWTLMPSGWRRALATVLSRWAPIAHQPWLQKALRPAGACGGCDSCDSGSTPPTPGRPQPVHIVRKPGR